MRFESLEWPPHVSDKIVRKHGVRPDEVEDMLFDGETHVRRGPEGVYRAYGQTPSDRYLFVVLVPVRRGTVRVVTARDMDMSERRLYLRR